MSEKRKIVYIHGFGGSPFSQTVGFLNLYYSIKLLIVISLLVWITVFKPINLFKRPWLHLKLRKSRKRYEKQN